MRTKYDVNASHQAWLKRWMGEPVTVSVTYETVWWETDENGDPYPDPSEERGFVSYTFGPSPNVKGRYHSTDDLWGEAFTAWLNENREGIVFEYTIADAAQLAADWYGAIWARQVGHVEDGVYEQDYRTGRDTMETLHIDGPDDKVEAVLTLMDAIRDHRWSPLDMEAA